MINLEQIEARRLIKGAVIGFKVQEDLDLPDINYPSYLANATIYTPEAQIDGHWLVRLHEEIKTLADPNHDLVIGVTSHKERIPHKTYTCALNYANAVSKRKLKTLNDMTSSSIRSLEQAAQTP